MPKEHVRGTQQNEWPNLDGRLLLKHRRRTVAQWRHKEIIEVRHDAIVELAIVCG